MKAVIAILIAMVLFAGCANDARIDGKLYEPKELFTMDEKDTTIKYKVSVGNVIWSCLLSETLIAPVVLCGWYLWEPCYKK